LLLPPARGGGGGGGLFGVPPPPPPGLPPPPPPPGLRSGLLGDESRNENMVQVAFARSPTGAVAVRRGDDKHRDQRDDARAADRKAENRPCRTRRRRWV